MSSVPYCPICGATASSVQYTPHIMDSYRIYICSNCENTHDGERQIYEQDMFHITRRRRSYDEEVRLHYMSQGRY
jgi:hypothetical protein